MTTLILIGIIIVLAGIIIFLFKSQSEKQRENKELKDKYGSIIDVDHEVDKKRGEYDKLQSDAEALSIKYKDARNTLMKLEHDVKLYQDDLTLIEYGVYEPSFDFDTSEDFKRALTDVKNRQKEMITNKSAAVCHTNWHVGGSAKKGEVKTNRSIKLTLRAFNGDCDTLIAKVKWNNIDQFEQRIRKSFEIINKTNKSNDIHISDEYLELKIEELKLTHELTLKKYEEKEEQRRIREQIREEEMLMREVEKAKKEAEKEERQYQKALEKAQKEVEQAQGEELDKLNSEIAKLQQALQEAHDSKERAISRAQMTKSGHVYIISNIGSFGEEVYKIGMTRRLEPMDRVKELGDASVPFEFDVHGMIYSENAPELENQLHKAFHANRVNMINNRKEYFNVSLSDIQDIVNNSTDAEIELTMIAEAKEYRETLALLKEMDEKVGVEGKLDVAEYPESPFDN